MTAFAWLNELMTWLGRWFPRLTLVKLGDVGILFSRSGRVDARPAGLWVWWPIVQDLKMVSLRLRSIEVAAQLHNGEAISMAIRWRVRDAIAASTDLNDPGAYLDDRIQARLAKAYSKDKSNETIATEVWLAIAEDMGPFGVDVVGADIVQRSYVLAIKDLKDYAQHENTKLEA